ncbi:tautomerase family protein [Azoarcus sp. L1K30]|uniref:tautomerase family protein n=1 Tax=Azoarcus sp. L1K30 TaxID=2820277 RepID=UPI001B831C32|nr:tautomerase family protein [Azoarcus sp. L1K30]MBR0565575.1 tautomerase family protein [Azoarcus sp. L1K30]
MPIVHFHLLEGASTPAQEEQLLLAACRLYAEVLDAPIDRIRAFITAHPTGRFAVGGELATFVTGHAPYFDFIVLAGRPVDQRHRLLEGFTRLLVEILGVSREMVRGECRQVAPEDWGIGGIPASAARKAEVDARTVAGQATRP